MMHGPTNIKLTITVLCKISGFRREVDENCVLLGDYAANSGNLKNPVYVLEP